MKELDGTINAKGLEKCKFDPYLGPLGQMNNIYSVETEIQVIYELRDPISCSDDG